MGPQIQGSWPSLGVKSVGLEPCTQESEAIAGVLSIFMCYCWAIEFRLSPLLLSFGALALGTGPGEQEVEYEVQKTTEAR